VSTILNALKKLEQEHKINKTGETLQPAQTLFNRRSLGYESWRDRLRHFNIRWTWVAIALIGLVVGYIVAGPDPAPTQPTPVQSSDLVALADRPESPASPVDRVEPGPAEIPGRTFPMAAAPQSAPSPVEAPPPDPKPLETEIIETKPLAAARKSVERSLAPLPEGSPRERAPLATPLDPTASAPEDQETGPEPELITSKDPQSSGLFSQAARLTDGRLEVQAIVWSPVAGDRMAVINNQIIHQGNTVEGFSVVEIGQDQVLVKEGGQYYVVYFGSR
jgi:hypothetical protein